MVHQRVFICGHFTSTTVNGLTKQLVNRNWEKGNVAVEEYVKEGYYSNFQSFMFSKSLSKGCSTFIKKIDRVVNLGASIVNVIELRLYIMPLSVVLFSIEIEQSSESVKELCATIRMLRNCRRYGKLSVQWTQIVVTPLKEICQFLTDNKNASFVDFVENSDRMKIMKIVWSDEGYNNTNLSMRRNLLYNLCTADYKTDDAGFQTDETPRYIFRIIRSYSLSIFKQWEALSLTDSFTVLYYDAMPDGIRKKQINRYGKEEEYDLWSWHFRVLYIYVLFQKCCLYKLNNRHLDVQKQKDANKDRSVFMNNIKQIFGQEDNLLLNLTNEMKYFENHYVFNTISYNTFTMELYNIIFKGLQISRDRQEVYRMIESEQKQFEALNTKILNQILFTLSLFTLFSAILAACQLIDSIVPFQIWLPNKSIGYLLISISIVLGFGLLILKITTVHFFKR